jgi:DNA-binding response OmpR family regulator
MPKKILIIEDDTRINEFYANVLVGYEVVIVTSTEDALPHLNSKAPFSLIISDLDLLGVSGFGLLELFKSRPDRPHPPVAICSSLTDGDTQKKVLDLGAVAFLPKPIQIDDLLALVARLTITGGAASQAAAVLPARTPPPPRPAPAPVEPPRVQTPSPAPAKARPASAGPVALLIIEDDTRIAEFYTKVFATAKVTLVTSCEDALGHLNAGAKFDLLLSDLDLLGMSGLQLLELFKSRPDRPHPPVVICSALSDAEMQRRVLALGAAAFVPKPIVLDDLLATVGRLIGV